MDVVPGNGGWRFPQPWAGGVRLLTAQTKGSLIKLISEFRTENDIPFGDPAKELDEYLINLQIPATQPTRTLRERVTAWKSNRQFSSHELVSPELAEERAQICANCPQNKMNWADGCSSCFDKTKRDLIALRQNRNTKTQVGACLIAGHDNSTAVFLSEASLKHRNQFMDKLPDFCWMKKL